MIKHLWEIIRASWATEMQLFEGSSSLNKGHPTNKSGNRDINAKISSNIYLITARMTCQWNSSADWVSMNVNVSTASWIKKSSYKTCQKRLLINILQLVKFHRQSSIWECQFRLTRSWQDHWMAGVCKANLGPGTVYSEYFAMIAATWWCSRPGQTNGHHIWTFCNPRQGRASSISNLRFLLIYLTARLLRNR